MTGVIFFSGRLINGTQQLFEVDYTGATQKVPDIRQITNGDFDVNGIVGQAGNVLIVSRADMNHAAELYAVDLGNGNMKQLTHVNDSIYNSIGKCKTERRWITQLIIRRCWCGSFIRRILILQKNIQPFILPGRASGSFDPVLFFSLEFSIDGFAGIYCCRAKQARYAGTWHKME